MAKYKLAEANPIERPEEASKAETGDAGADGYSVLAKAYGNNNRPRVDSDPDSYINFITLKG